MGIDPSVGALKAFFQQSTKENPSAENLFSALNITYNGPIDGHNLEELLAVFNAEKKKQGPRLIHIRTTKGKGLAQKKNKFFFMHRVSLILALSMGKQNIKP